MQKEPTSNDGEKEEKPCNHFMVWSIQGGYSYYCCSRCSYINGDKTLFETRAKAKEEARNEVVEEMKKIINESVEEATKEHGSPNVYIDMVGETLSEKLLAFLPDNK